MKKLYETITKPAPFIFLVVVTTMLSIATLTTTHFLKKDLSAGQMQLNHINRGCLQRERENKKIVTFCKTKALKIAERAVRESNGLKKDVKQLSKTLAGIEVRRRKFQCLVISTTCIEIGILLKERLDSPNQCIAAAKKCMSIIKKYGTQAPYSESSKKFYTLVLNTAKNEIVSSIEATKLLHKY